MSVRVEEIKGDRKEEWNNVVSQSPHTTFFHRLEALAILARHFEASLHPLIGYVGQEPVGLLPMFGQTKGPFLLATSPPLSVEISAGPALLNFEKLKTRKAEQRHQAFVDSCFEWIEEEMEPDLVEIKTPSRYSDVRPFIRQGCSVSPSYTYVLDLSRDEQTLLDQFSTDARNSIRTTDDAAYDITEGGRDVIEEIGSTVQDRFEALGEYHYLDTDLLVDLYETCGSSSVRPYACWVDGNFASGMIVLEHGDTVYSWQGGSKPDAELPVNELLDWQIIRDGKRRGMTRYDMVGAMIPRLCEYKSKFGPEAEPIYVIKQSSPAAKIAEKTYRRMPTTVREVFDL